MGVKKILRRTFLIGAGAVAGGVAVGVYYYNREPENPLLADLPDGDGAFNPFVMIGADGRVTVVTGRAEMGQGAETGLAMLVAEELDVDLDQVTVAPGPASSAYRNIAMLAESTMARPFAVDFAARAERASMGAVAEVLGVQATGGSSSIRDGFVKMRAAGAAAREMLKAAAAERLGVAAADLRTEKGRVIAGGDSLGYGELAAAAAAMTPPEDVRLRNPRDWRLIGRSQGRTDAPAKVTGQAVFGVDVDLPDMVHATVKMSPRLGGVVSHDDAAALAVPGVEKVVRLTTDDADGFGVIAANTWAAFKGAEALEVEWAPAPHPPTVEAILDDYRAAMDAAPGAAFREEGDADAALAEAPADEVLEAEYTAPFLAHACMEPMNATAQLKDGKGTVWAPTQSAMMAQMTAATAMDVGREDVTVHTTYLGGGFGRRGESDYVRFAALLAKETGGRPVKVTWTREEDTRHDMYRPAAIARMRARLKPGGAPTVFAAQLAAPSIMQGIMSRTLFTPPSPSPDRSAAEGIFDQPLDFDHVAVRAVHPAQTLPVGFWRSVGNSQNGFFQESFLDEVAHASGVDPVEMRLSLMANYPAARNTMKRAAEMAGWGRDPGPGRGLGAAFTYSFGTHVAQVVEVSSDDGEIRVENVWCACDIGLAIDPDNVKRQMQSGVIYGLSAAVMQKITLEDGAVVEGNFWDYDAMRMSQCPNIEVAVLESAEKMGGAGEPGLPPVAGALGNAIFAATGQRIRNLPFGDHVDFAV